MPTLQPHQLPVPVELSGVRLKYVITLRTQKSLGSRDVFVFKIMAWLALNWNLVKSYQHHLIIASVYLRTSLSPYHRHQKMRDRDTDQIFIHLCVY